MPATQSKLFEAFGAFNGYPHGVRRLIEADTIEEAHDIAEEKLDEVIYVSEIQRCS